MASLSRKKSASHPVLKVRDIESVLSDLKERLEEDGFPQAQGFLPDADVVYKGTRKDKPQSKKKYKKNAYYYHRFGKYKKSGDPWRPERRERVKYNYDKVSLISEFKEVNVDLVRSIALKERRINSILSTEIVKGIGINDAGEGRLYILESKCSTYVKIGRTINDPKMRLSDYSKKHALEGELRLHAAFPTSLVNQVEKDVHSRLKHKRRLIGTGARELFDVNADYASELIKNVLLRYNNIEFVNHVINTNVRLREEIKELENSKRKAENSLKNQFKRYLKNKSQERYEEIKNLEEYLSLSNYRKIVTRIPMRKGRNNLSQDYSLIQIAAGRGLAMTFILIIPMFALKAIVDPILELGIPSYAAMLFIGGLAGGLHSAKARYGAVRSRFEELCSQQAT